MTRVRVWVGSRVTVRFGVRLGSRGAGLWVGVGLG